MAQWHLGWGFLAVFALIGLEAGVRGICYLPKRARRGALDSGEPDVQ